VERRRTLKHSVERHTTVRAPTTINTTLGERKATVVVAVVVPQRRAAGVAGVPRGGGDSPGPAASASRRPSPVGSIAAAAEVRVCRRHHRHRSCFNIYRRRWRRRHS